ncbi:MAG: helix-turn-helix transcriptional regulator [Thermodesulfovibrionales bacterium]|nr:helix-turn-helix transcriptional regulator [Thermodesulfovibrionales bacterium]
MVKETGRNRVREFREAKPWSIAELARAAGVAYQTISKMENGLSTRRHTQLKVAKALGKNHEEVFP